MTDSAGLAGRISMPPREFSTLAYYNRFYVDLRSELTFRATDSVGWRTWKAALTAKLTDSRSEQDNAKYAGADALLPVNCVGTMSWTVAPVPRQHGRNCPDVR
jgi:nicotinamide riboside transporter PnuC